MDSRVGAYCASAVRVATPTASTSASLEPSSHGMLSRHIVDTVHLVTAPPPTAAASDEHTQLLTHLFENKPSTPSKPSREHQQGQQDDTNEQDSAWFADLYQRARSKGISPQVIDQLLAELAPHLTATPQAEHPIIDLRL